MTLSQAFSVLEIAARCMSERQQTSNKARAGLNTLRGRVTRWKLNELWDRLQTDCASRSGAIVSAFQNFNVALNGVRSGTEGA
jgi:hypothetical protein